MNVNSQLQRMPRTILATIVLLLVSAGTCTLGLYLDMEILLGSAEVFYSLYLLDAIWLVIIICISWFLARRKRDVRSVIALIGFVILASILIDIFVIGITSGTYAYIAEGCMYAAMLFLLNTRSAKNWVGLGNAPNKSVE